MDDQAEDIIRRELGDSEELLWAGRPRQGLFLRASDWHAIPFSLLWGGFAIFWETIAITTGAPLFFPLWGIPFVLVGLHIMFGRFFVDAWQRAATTYGVTSQRVIIVSGIISHKVRSLNLETLNDISITEGWNGRGTIIFGSLATVYGPRPAAGWPRLGQPLPSFELADGVRDVYELVVEAQRSSSRHVESRASRNLSRDERFRAS